MSDRILKESDVIREVESLLVSDEMRHLNDLEYGNNQALYHVIDRIEDLPSADRPQGYWIKTDDATYRCSECGKKQIADDINELNFCCCCGSRNKVRKMKGADDE